MTRSRLCLLYTSQLRFAARGFFNSRSKITVRVLTRDQQELITPDFFRTRIEFAWRNRRKFGFENSCRVVFGETDGRPGLTVDKFADYLSFQITCLGLESVSYTHLAERRIRFRPPLDLLCGRSPAARL